MAASDRPGRMYYIDYIRAFIIVLVIVLHAAVSYLSFFPYKWIVVDSAASLACDYVVLASEYFAVAVLFFIAGYLLPPSLEKQGPSRYARSRLQRLGIPMLFGLCIASPVMTYVRDLGKSRDPGNYLSYWFTAYFQGKIYAGYLWFLSTLLVFMLVACLVWRLSPGLRFWLCDRSKHSAGRLFTPAGLLSLAIGIGLCMFAANLFIPDGYWVRLGQKGIITFQPTRLPLYAGFFIWGILACRWGWSFLLEADLRQTAGWTAGSILCLCAYICLLQSFHADLESSVLLRFFVCLLRAVGPLCLTMVIIGVFKARFNRQARWKDLLAANSYGMYVAHIPFVVTLQYWLLKVDIAAPAKFIVVAGLSLPLSFLASHFIIRRLPVIGRYF